MGKKRKKTEQGKEKIESKTVKAMGKKKARRDSKKPSLEVEDDIAPILLSIQSEVAKKKRVHVKENVPARSCRSKCTLNVDPLKETELILYRGEFNNGNESHPTAGSSVPLLVAASSSSRRRQRMSTAIGACGGEDTPQTQGSPGSGKRGITTGASSKRAKKGNASEVVIYDPKLRTFYQPVREEKKKIGTFANRLGVLIRVSIPLHVPTWSEVTPQAHAAILTGLHKEFTFVYTDMDTSELVPADRFRSEIDAAILRDAMRIFRNAKSKLSRRFRITCHGSREIAKNKTPKGISQADWEATIDRFESEEFKKVSERNKDNQKHKTTVSRQGTMSFAHHRWLNRRTDGRLASALDTWMHFHKRTNGTWTTPAAELAYNQVVEQVADVLRQAEEKGVECDVDAAEEAAMTIVLGERRDWSTGIGPLIPRTDLLKAKARDLFEDGSSSRSQRSKLESQQTELERYRSELESQQVLLQSQQAMIQSLEATVRDLTASLTRLSPSETTFVVAQTRPQTSPASTRAQTRLQTSLPSAEGQSSTQASASQQRSGRGSIRTTSSRIISR